MTKVTDLKSYLHHRKGCLSGTLPRGPGGCNTPNQGRLMWGRPEYLALGQILQKQETLYVLIPALHCQKCHRSQYLSTVQSKRTRTRAGGPDRPLLGPHCQKVLYYSGTLLLQMEFTRGRDQPTTASDRLLLYSLQAKNGFYTFIQLESIEQLFHDM